MKSGKAAAVIIIGGFAAIFMGLLYLLFGDRFERAVPAIKPISTSESAAGENAAAQTSPGVLGTAETSVCETTAVTETVSTLTVVFPLDINFASAEELTAIDGIGAVLAGNIVEYRSEHGFFYSTDELLNVKGIGNAKLDRIKACVSVDKSMLPETVPETVPETSAALTAAALSGSSVTSSARRAASETAAVTSVPKQSESTAKTSASTVTAVTQFTTVTTEDEDDGIIIQEITDFTDFDLTDPAEYIEDEDGGYVMTSFTSDSYRPNFPLELNTASARDLAYIDGIGDVLAERIAEYAAGHGFYDVNDLLNVNGIGQSKLEAIRPYVYVDASRLPPRAETTSAYYGYDPYAPDSFGGGGGYAPSQTPQVYRVNVNTGSKADFMQLPGIDETLAESIIAFRNSIGGFQKLEELVLADGMTNNKLSAIWNYIYL